MFDEADKHGIVLSEEQYLAILFHDVVYNPTSMSNEEASCNVFDEYVFGLKAISFDVRLVKQIIMDTQNHIPTCEESKIIIDLDLIGLASSEEQYYKNAKLIEWEYTHNNAFTIEEFNKGRIGWLEAMLNKNPIFYTKWFKNLEKYVKFNIAEELDIRRQNKDGIFTV